MHCLNALVLRAAENSQDLEQLIAQHECYILKCASNTSHRYITRQDDEWSIALQAFSQAVTCYSPEKGSFLSFAQLLIHRRLIDYFRTQVNIRTEILIPTVIFEEAPEEDSEHAALHADLIKHLVKDTQEDLRWEIESIGQVLKQYGFTLYHLVGCSPKAHKTQMSCAKAVHFLLNSPVFLGMLRKNKLLPIKMIALFTDVPQKILERHRKYIIAAVEILTGEYPFLSQYLKTGRK